MKLQLCTSFVKPTAPCCAKSAHNSQSFVVARLLLISPLFSNGIIIPVTITNG